MRVFHYPPQYIEHANGDWTGMAVELGETLLKRAGCTITYINAPWKRSLKLAEEGAIDVMPYLSMNATRSEYLHFIGPIREEVMVLVVLDESDFHIESLQDFKKLRLPVGGVIGAYYGDSFEELYKRDRGFARTISLSVDPWNNVDRVKLKRLAGLITDKDDFEYRARVDKRYRGLKAHPFVVHRNSVYFGVSKHSVSSQHLGLLKTSFNRVEEEGGFESIVRHYF